MVVTLRLKSFPLAIVKSVSNQYNKAFHAKIFTLFVSSESEVHTLSLRQKPNYDFCFAFMKDNEGQWFLDTKGIAGIREWVLKDCKSDRKEMLGLYNKWEKDWKEYLKFTRKIDNTDLSKLSNEGLYTLFQKFYDHYLLVGSSAYITDSFMSTGTEDWLEKLVLKELGEKGNVAIVRKLTSPVHFSFTLEAEQHLLDLAVKIKQKYNDKLPEFGKLDEESKRKLNEIEQNFHWIQNNYFNVHFVSSREFYQQIFNLIKENEVENLRDKRESELKKVKTEREELIKNSVLSDFLKNVLETARLFAKWKDIRKSGVYRGMHYFDRFLGEIATRSNYSKEDINFLIFPEIKDLRGGKDLSKVISQRKKQCFFAVTPEGYFISEGKEADKYFKCFKTDNVNAVEIRGVVASPGYARGRVRIIRKTGEMAQFQTGEILVANQTTPEFVPIMKKAGAIITEQGGITSHAAIVSRELKKPCIIGTKIATSALMNGEVVEVDANNGIVRRLR